MLNPYSLYYLWQIKIGKDYITSLINKSINSNEEYELLNFFNKSFNNVRSYVLFESISNIVLIDFNLKNRIIDDDLVIINILKKTSNKRIFFILFNNMKGENIISDDIIYIYKDDSFIFADNLAKQLSANKELTDYLYQMPNDLYKLYLHEYNLIDNNNKS